MDHPILPATVAEHYALRPICATDATAWYDYLREPDVVQHTSWNLGGEAQLEAQIRAQYLSTVVDHPIRFALVALSSDKLVGTVGFNGVVQAHRHAEIAYDLAPGYWGQGLAGHACMAVVQWGISCMGLNRIHAHVLDTNTRSIRVLEKCGFQLEGTLRQYRMVRDEPRDFLLYALLAEDLTGDSAKG
ncbi:GNAT family N-acetyltransferase [Pigmentiphaga aceris]|uniref:GNAT family N-acetyltransferase n=1 Tax=Pigmentiphaga aceris TaxID=1940612 RepID=UPI001FE63BC3|nr:GNAT family protein [Pigmentiphaga aceris]